MDLNKDYFLMISKSRQNVQDLGLIPKEQDFINKTTGENYYSSPLFDCGWGSQQGYVLDHKYSFDELIKLSLQKSKSEHNNFGAIEFIIMGTTRQNHFREEFINFVKYIILAEDYTQITDYFQYFLYLPFMLEDKLEKNDFYLNELQKHTDWREIEAMVFDRLESTGLYNRWIKQRKKDKYDVRGRLQLYP